MIDTKKIEILAQKVHDSLPKGIRDFSDDMEKKIRQIIHNQLVKINLISREEFDIQTQALIRIREKAAKLEARIIQLENRLANQEDKIE